MGCCPRQCYYEDANGKPCSDSPKEEPKEEPKKEPKKDSTKPAEVCADGCSTWFDGCNTCSCTKAGELRACTRKMCVQNQEPKCMDDDNKEIEIEHAALTFASDQSDVYENIGPMTKKEKLDTRESMKKDLEYSGIDKRKVPIFQSVGCKLNGIYKTADAKKAGLDDKAVEEVTKNAMEKNEDCGDYNDKTKKEIITAVDAVVAGGLKSDLKLKANKTVTIQVCRVDKAVTTKDIASLVADSKEVKKVTDETTVQIIKTPKQDPISKETCAASSYSPKKGSTTAEFVKAAKTLKFTRSALRMLVGRELADSGAATTSTGETNLIVPGDDDSVATNPGAATGGPGNMMLIIGLVVGCLCVVALVVIVLMVVKKKEKKCRCVQRTCVQTTC